MFQQLDAIVGMRVVFRGELEIELPSGAPIGPISPICERKTQLNQFEHINIHAQCLIRHFCIVSYRSRDDSREFRVLR